jgi:hypothetical protein
MVVTSGVTEVAGSTPIADNMASTDLSQRVGPFCSTKRGQSEHAGTLLTTVVLATLAHIAAAEVFDFFE